MGESFNKSFFRLNNNNSLGKDSLKGICGNIRKLTQDMMEQEDEYLSIKSKEKRRGSTFMSKTYYSADKTCVYKNKKNNGSGI